MVSTFVVIDRILGGGDVAATAFDAAWVFLTLAFLLRFGLLAFVVAALTGSLLGAFVVTLDFSAWYATSVLIALCLFVGTAGYGFYRAVVWQGGIPDLFGEH